MRDERYCKQFYSFSSSVSFITRSALMRMLRFLRPPFRPHSKGTVQNAEAARFGRGADGRVASRGRGPAPPRRILPGDPAGLCRRNLAGRPARRIPRADCARGRLAGRRARSFAHQQTDAPARVDIGAPARARISCPRSTARARNRLGSMPPSPAPLGSIAVVKH